MTSLKQHLSSGSVISLQSTSLSLLIQSIGDNQIRQQLSQRYERILGQTKIELITILLQSAEAKMRQYQDEFDQEMAQLWQHYRQSSIEQRITRSMMNLIDQRLANITERFQAIHQYQIKSFFA